MKQINIYTFWNNKLYINVYTIRYNSIKHCLTEYQNTINVYRTSKSFQTLHYYTPKTFTDLLIAVAENVRRIISDLNQSVLVLLQVDINSLNYIDCVYIIIEKIIFYIYIEKVNEISNPTKWILVEVGLCCNLAPWKPSWLSFCSNSCGSRFPYSCFLSFSTSSMIGAGEPNDIFLFPVSLSSTF